MSASFYDLMRYAKTGVASSGMTHYDKMKARAMFGGWPEQTLTGAPPLQFLSNGKPLTSWSIAGNMVQTGTPSPSNIIWPQECGELVESGEHSGQYAIPITLAGQTQNIYLSEPLRKIRDYADVVNSDGTVTRRIKKIALTGDENWGFFDPAFATQISGILPNSHSVCNAYQWIETYLSNDLTFTTVRGVGTYLWIRDNKYGGDVASFKAFLAQMYAAGTPVTLWYILNTPEIETFTAPTLTPAKGSNTLYVNTTLAPSSVSITGGIKSI